MSYTKFRNKVWAHYRKHGRHALPWRATRNPYRILVSEIMLQQTQVDRVIPYYRAFIKKFPTVRALAEASPADVLRAWQGLGYNRRARLLQEAARAVVEDREGIFPKSVEEMEALPGVGPYTARAVAAFSYNADAIFIETNIRTAVMHHFFPGTRAVSNADIARVLARVYPRGRAREWHSALMDYGAYLKRSGVQTNSRVKGYAKQKKFDGSLRQARGAVLRALAAKSYTSAALLSILGDEREAQVKEALTRLREEGLIENRGKAWRLPV